MTIREFLWEILFFLADLVLAVSGTFHNFWNTNFLDLKIADIGIMSFLFVVTIYGIYQHDKDEGILPKWSKKTLLVSYAAVSIFFLCILVFLSQYFHPYIEEFRRILIEIRVWG